MTVAANGNFIYSTLRKLCKSDDIYSLGIFIIQIAFKLENLNENTARDPLTFSKTLNMPLIPSKKSITRGKMLR